MTEYNRLSTLLGNGVLGLQSYFNYNLTQRPNIESAPEGDVRDWLRVLWEGVEETKEYQQVLDPYVASNVSIRISHQILHPTCDCEFCAIIPAL